MNLNTVHALQRPTSLDEVKGWETGHAWLAGGTWLFSEPQPGTDKLIDLGGLNWPHLTIEDGGLTISAMCRNADIFRFEAPPEWVAARLFQDCCNCFLASFKIWNSSTVGGNIVMSLPAGPMISLTAALEGICTLWPRDGAPREVKMVDFVTGPHANVLQPGELLRSIHLPGTVLRKRYAIRHMSLTKLGRSAALIIGTSGPARDLTLTISASTTKPFQLYFATIPTAAELKSAIDTQIPAENWFGDVHGTADYKQHIARYYAEQIRSELAA